MSLAHLAEHEIVPVLAHVPENFWRGASAIVRLTKGTRILSVTASADRPPNEWPTRCTGAAARRITASRISASWAIPASRAVRRSTVPPYPSRLVVTQRKPFSHCATMGRHAAPVLHDPGTRTTVGPPAFVVVDMSELIFDHGASTPADQARLAEGAPSDDRRADDQSSERRLRELAGEDA
jgi:hypothetical protein